MDRYYNTYYKTNFIHIFFLIRVTAKSAVCTSSTYTNHHHRHNLLKKPACKIFKCLKVLIEANVFVCPSSSSPVTYLNLSYLSILCLTLASCHVLIFIMSNEKSNIARIQQQVSFHHYTSTIYYVAALLQRNIPFLYIATSKSTTEWATTEKKKKKQALKILYQ